MKRTQILEASMRLFVSKGAHAVTIAQIAQEATVGIGTVYKHFSSKEDIIQQIWIWQKEQESVFVFKDYVPRGSIKEQFDLLWRRVIKYFLNHPVEFMFSYQFAASPVLTPEIHEIAMKDFLVFDDLYKRGLKENTFKKLSPRHLRLFTFSTINGWLLWAFDEKMRFTEKTIDLFLQMAWDSVKK